MEIDADVDAPQWGHDLAENTLRSMVKQLLIDGFFHSDPGNLLVNLQTGEINFLDPTPANR